MVTHPTPEQPLPLAPDSRGGWLMIELLVAISLLAVALLPFAYSFAAEKKLARTQYQKALAMEIVDGEMEILAAGEWREYRPGTHPYKTTAAAATNLPPGHFTLTVAPDRLTLQWTPSTKTHGGPVTREAKTK
jgi:type II secretory pathway pseudopilin PulG